jgi:putative ABC transport system permease protein
MSRRTGVLHSQLVDAARRPARVLLMAVAMIIAAFVTFGTVLASNSTEQTTLNSFSGTPAAVDVVLGEGTGATIRTLAAVRELPEVAEAVARIDTGFTSGSQGGIDLTVVADPGTGPLAKVSLVRGDYPDAANEVAVSERTADRLGLSVGDQVSVEPVRFDNAADPDAQPVPATPIPLSVVGVVDASEDFGDSAYTTEEFALRLTGEEWLPRIDVRLAPGVDVDSAMAALARAAEGTVPADAGPVAVSSGAEIRYAEVLQVSDRVKDLFALIGMFVSIAVVAAAMVATSTFRIVFAQRMRQLALLRAVGAGRGGLLRALVAEGAITGLAAGTIGVLAASALGFLLPPVLRSLGPDVATPDYPTGWAVGVVLGTGMVTVLAVLAPAVTAARVAPLEALRTASVSAGQRGINLVRAVAGFLLAVAALGVGLLAYLMLPGPDPQNYDASRTLLTIVASGALAYAALVALGPLLVRPVLAAVGWPLRRLGPLGRLAVGGVGGAPRRAAAVSVVVALGVTLVAGALVGGASLRELTSRELAGQAPADLNVLAATAATGHCRRGSPTGSGPPAR